MKDKKCSKPSVKIASQPASSAKKLSKSVLEKGMLADSMQKMKKK